MDAARKVYARAPSASGSGSEDDEDNDELMATSMSDTDNSDIDPGTMEIEQPRGGCRPCVTAKCCCHVCYVVQFCIYMVVFPLWCKYLVSAPMPYEYWGSDFPDFPKMPLEMTDFARQCESSPQIAITPIPMEQTACNYSCSVDYHKFQNDEMNFHVSLDLNSSGLEDENAHTLFPLLFASEDFKSWHLAAERSNAQPEPFWRSRDAALGHTYSHLTPPCTRKPTAKETFTNGATYIVGCVTWRYDSVQALSELESLTNEELGQHCDSVGGVCGWPCGSTMPSSRLQSCDRRGIFQVSQFAKQELNKTLVGTVKISACEDPLAERCITDTAYLGQWSCHKCTQAKQEEDNAQMSDDEPPESADDVQEKYISLPRFLLQLENVPVPTGMNVLNAPRVFVLAAPDLTGTWAKLYQSRSGQTQGDEKEPPLPVPVGGVPPESIVEEDPATETAMTLVRTNRLRMRPTSCYGRRGPLYLVACAVNASVYAGETFVFEPGQEIAPPPFNDRCLAVSGRCGHACMQRQGTMSYCDENGYINQTLLVGKIKPKDNRQVPVMMFVYVLLCGFCVKVVMLCPGIFSEYRHCHRYSPELTEQLRYIVVVTPSAGGDENKCVTMRNLIGTLSCMPRNCACRFHTILLDEGHRYELKVCWQKFTNVIGAVPNFGGTTYEDNLMAFMQVWCEETKKLTLGLIGGKVKELTPENLNRISGRSALKRLKTEGGWGEWDPNTLAVLTQALEVFADDLRHDNKFSVQRRNLDDIVDWEPRDRRNVPLRLHYIARSKPIEDERALRSQHVAPGTYYYKIGPDSKPEDWLDLRKDAREMVYGLDDDDDTSFIVPIHTSRGKAGALNFAENYLVILSERPENRYGDHRDDAPFLYSIADARHQFQPDFLSSCLPYFYTRAGQLDTDVAFTQCPQHFHESDDKSDYLDTNNAQFFRLNCMIRNCCGGVSSCGTNGIWLINHQNKSTIWVIQKKRVRDIDGRKNHEVIERTTFHESCKVEDTASSLQRVLEGRRSQYINRKLSYGMAKNSVSYLAATQRWAEGGVVLHLQTFWACRGETGIWMLWCTVFAFAAFIASVIHLVTKRDGTWWIVSAGFVDQETAESWVLPLETIIREAATEFHHYKLLRAEWVSNDYKAYTMMLTEFIVWLFMIIVCFFIVQLITICGRLICRRCCIFPSEMRWCARLIISMDNLTYFVWFWTAFFWVGFNYYCALVEIHFHFNINGMMSFMLLVNVLTWGMIFANSWRYSLEQSMEANEIATLSMDNIWRSNQLFYISAPVQAFSIIVGFRGFLDYEFYGKDDTAWGGADRGSVAINLVKYWTLLLIIGCVVVWVCFITYAHKYVNALSATIIVTLIALDVLHPCVYIWVGDSKLTREEAKKMTWCQALTNPAWWARRLHNLVLNETLTGLLKYLGPVFFLTLPISYLFLPYLMVNGSFMMVVTANAR